eukprot:m.183088 g.183088  ORF g.183088 m.183088 type:complete len:175 (+) comp15539_c0_seq6:529-1053(+)
MLENPYVAGHWRAEKVHGNSKMWKNVSAAADKVIRIMQELKEACSADKIFFATDFFSKYGTHSHDLHKWLPVDQLRIEFARVVKTLDAVTFDPLIDYPVATAANNSMAIAAVELTIMSRASSFLPIVKSGAFVDTIEKESQNPRVTASYFPHRVEHCQKLTPSIKHIQKWGLSW